MADSKWPEATAVIVVAVSTAVAITGWPKLENVESQTWAAWVQAVGSVLAIAAAIWISHREQKKALARRAQETREAVLAMLQGLKDEICMLWLRADETIGAGLRNRTAGRGLWSTFPVGDSPFPVFRSVVGRLGSVPNDELRARVIAAYALGQSLLTTVAMNNQLLAKLEHYSGLAGIVGGEQLVAPNHPSAKLRDYYGKAHLQYAEVLDDIYGRVRAAVTAVVPLIEAYIGNSTLGGPNRATAEISAQGPSAGSSPETWPGHPPPE